ncbi:MAG: hydrogenase maturation protease [Chloroflexia bacterium]|nr:hydrogenase maturation protease [Chloroflexia bacterium]
MTRVLVAGMGNVLRRDDGFGFELARTLAGSVSLPADVRVIEVGIGGIHLVQELMDGYDALIVLDAVERGSAPGTVHLLAVDVPDLATWSDDQRGDFLADTHYTTPSKAMILARALGVLPPRVYILGCQPTDAGELGIGLTPPVARAMSEAVETVERLVRQLGLPAAADNGRVGATVAAGGGTGDG